MVFACDKDTKYMLMFVTESFFGAKWPASCDKIALILMYRLLYIGKIMYLCAFKLNKL